MNLFDRPGAPVVTDVSECERRMRVRMMTVEAVNTQVNFFHNNYKKNFTFKFLSFFGKKNEYFKGKWFKKTDQRQKQSMGVGAIVL